MEALDLHPTKRLEFHDLELFPAVAETGSLRKAVIGLRTGQPSVSRRVRKLADALGVSLFERWFGDILDEIFGPKAGDKRK